MSNRPRELRLQIVHEQSCFVNLPPALIHAFDPSVTPIVLRLRWNASEGPTLPAAEQERAWTHEAHVGWGGGSCSADHVLEMPAPLAEALGLRPPQLLDVQAVQLPLATSVCLQAEASRDWEVAQREAKRLEERVLMQVCLHLLRGRRWRELGTEVELNVPCHRSWWWLEASDCRFGPTEGLSALCPPSRCFCRQSDCTAAVSSAVRSYGCE
jgi:hypothetical protein